MIAFSFIVFLLRVYFTLFYFCCKSKCFYCIRKGCFTKMLHFFFMYFFRVSIFVFHRVEFQSLRSDRVVVLFLFFLSS